MNPSDQWLLNSLKKHDEKQLKHLPKIVIMDLKEAVKDFRDAMAANAMDHEFLVWTLDEILIYIANAERAGIGIEALLANVKESLDRQDNYDAMPVILPSMYRLAHAMWREALSHRLYTRDGYLPYQFKDMIDSNSPILKLI